MNLKSKIIIFIFFIGYNICFGSTFLKKFNPKIDSLKNINPVSFSFTENKGQVHDQFYNPRHDIKYSGSDNGLNFYLKSNGISYQLMRVDSWKDDTTEYKPKRETKNKIIDQSTIYRIDIDWIGSNNNPEIINGKSLGGYDNYYQPSCPDGALNVRSFENIIYKAIYPGIDLKYYSNEGHLKYDYIVSVGADYKKIKFKINGATKLSLNKNGDLIINTPLGDIIENAPIVKQEGKIIKAKWVISENELSFLIDKIDITKAFIIDPLVRIWGTFYGGGGGPSFPLLNTYDQGRACSSDASGNAYLMGQTESINNISTIGSYQSLYNGLYDTFLVKFNSSGVRQWGTYFGGNLIDDPWDLTLDGFGNSYIVGCTNNNSGISTIGSHQSSYSGAYDGFLVKFNTAGILQWSTYYGGTGYDDIQSVTNDELGNIYICGTTLTNSGNAIATVGSHQSNYGGGNQDAYIAKFNSSGIRQWGTYYGGSNGEPWTNICCNKSGNIYLTGCTDSFNNIVTIGTQQQSMAGNVDAFLAKFNYSGTRIWGTYFGGTGNEFTFGPNNCIADNIGNVYIAGGTDSQVGISTLGAHQTSYGGSWSDAYLVKFNSSGIRTWGTYFGGNQQDLLHDVSIDNNGNVIIVGQTVSLNNISTPGAYQANNLSTGTGGLSAFIAKFNTNGTIIFGTYYGGQNGSYALEANVDLNNNLYICGAATGTDNINIATPQSHQPNNAGGDDAFLVKFADCPGYTLSANFNPTLCLGNILNLSASSSESTAINFTWLGPNSFTSSLQSPTISNISLLNSGIYTVSATNPAGCSGSTTINVTINAIAAPSITISNANICSGQIFTISPSGASNYTIQGGNNIVSPISSTNYTIVGTNSLGCVSQNIALFSLTVNPNPTITLTNSSICSGTNFLIVPTGASTYTIQGGSFNVTPTITTNYTVTGTSALGCISPTFAVLNLIVNPNPTITVNSGVICAGQNFTINPSGANTYTIQGGNAIVSPLSNTNYTVIGTNTLTGCRSQAVATSSLIVNANPTIIVNSGAICAGQNFTINPNGANTYTIQGGNTVVSPTVNTTYTVIGTNTLTGCRSQAFAISSLIVNTNPIITVNSGIICAGQNFTINPSGANTYTIQGGNSVVSPPSNAIFTVAGTSTAGCLSQAVATSSLIVNANPTITVNSGAICAGQNFTINPNGANTYTIQSGNAIVSPLSNTNYTVIGTNTLTGCRSQAVATSSLIVNANPTIIVNSGAICAGQNFTINPSGANTYTIQGGNAVVSPASNANYTVIGTSTAGCVSQAVATSNLIVYANPTITVNSGAICAGQNFTINPSGANTYTIQGGNAVVSPASNTSFTVIGTSTAGCKSQTFATSNLTVNPLPSLTSSITINTSSCGVSSGSISGVVVTGASSYTWTNGLNSVVGTSANLFNQPAGVYQLKVSNANGCINIFGPYSISNPGSPSVPSVSASANSLCAGQAITLFAASTPSVTYNWFGPGFNSSLQNPIIASSSPTMSGVYSVNAALLGCTSAAAQITITVNPNPTISVNSGSICAGQNFTINPSGANTYTIQGGNAVVSPLSNSNFTVAGTSTAGCVSQAVATSSLIVNVNPIIIVNSGSICAGQNFTINPSGANTYTIQGGNAVVSPASNTSFTVIGTSTAGCKSQAFATSNLTVNPLPSLTSSITINTSSCGASSGSISGVIVTGASSYTWTNGLNSVVGTSANLFNQPAGVYQLKVSNANGCINIFGPYSISNPGSPSVPSVSASANSLCAGQAITLFAASTPSVTYNWFGPGFNSSLQNPIIASSSPTMSGVYSVNATLLGCTSAAAQITITVNTNPTITVNSGSICAGQNFTINPSGATTYTIQGGNAVVSPLSNTTYTVAGINSFGCKNINPISCTLTVVNLPSLSVNSGSICGGGTYTFLPSGAYTYTYLNGSSIVSPSITTNYTIIGSNQVGCVNSIGVIGTVSVSLTKIIASSGTICVGSNFTINPTGALTYTYSSGTSIVSPSVNSSYTIYGTGVDDCVSIAIIDVETRANPTLTFVTNNYSICSGSSALLQIIGSNSYTWNTGSTSNSIIVTPTITSTFSVIGKTLDDCISIKSQEIVVLLTPSVNLGPDLELKLNESHQFNVIELNSFTYSWTPSDFLNFTTVLNPITTPKNNITYTITVFSKDGCIASDDIELTIKEELIIANYMSPNGDGQNDTWNLNYPFLIKDYSIEIIDSYNQRVFYKKDNYNNEFDGKLNGKELLDGVYYYFIIDGKNIKYKGSITLIK
jgi:gliding motility-associated-like protein